MKNFTLLKFLFAMQFIWVTACEPQPDDMGLQGAENFTLAPSGDYLENFENATKTSYAGGTVNFGAGDWYFNEALLGKLAGDAKNGSQSVRMRYSGSIRMDFDLAEGAKTVSLKYAKYGKDKASSFALYFSTNQGASWTLAGQEVNATKTNLQSVTFNLNVSGPVSLEIRKTDGGSARLNIDDLVVEPNPVAQDLTDISEDFEAGSKGSYAAGTVDLSSGSWFLQDALIGTLDNDRKSGLKSVRIRDYGMLQMNYDVTGAQWVSLSHGVYGSDSGSSWELQTSVDGGSSWSTVGGLQNSNSTSLETLNFTLNLSGNVRFRIVKLSGSGDRINIDNFVIGGTADTSGDPGDPSDGDGGTGEGMVHYTMGNPSGAVTDLNSPNNYLLEKEEYVMSYSRDKGTANWVSWHLDESWLGEAPRQDDFRADNTLPSSWYQVSQTDYQYSGFDRGHMCPSADRTLSTDDNSNTFFMTNMMPQSPNNNRLAWARLESHCRSLLEGGNEIYIISGGYGKGGEGSNGYAETLAGGKIQVPSNTWKVIMVIPDGNDDVNRVTTNTTVIAVDMPNDQTVSSDWTPYITTVDDIEAKTGYDFFDLVSDAIEDVIENKTYNTSL